MNPRVCILCGKEIDRSRDAIKYEQMIFDTYWCLETFKKLKAVFGNSIAW
jgi:hypothetical protein